MARRGLTLPCEGEGGAPPPTFREFIDAVNPRYKWYTHCQRLAAVLQRVADGEIKRLMVFMPPRHGKSELVSRLFSAYYLCRHPGQWVGLNSYGAELAYTLSRAARENFLRGGGKIKDDAAAVKHWETPQGGGLWAAGVGGPITGKGWNLGIIDDPLKNAEEANSSTIKEHQKEWYGSTFYTREEPSSDGEPDGSLIIIQTRWNESDLSGWLLGQERTEDEPEGWHIVSYEAIKEEQPQDFPPSCTVEPDFREPGEALCPERRPVAKLRLIAKRIGEYFWNALFQQRPRAKDGNCFKQQWFRYWSAEQGGALYRLQLKDGMKLVKASDCRRFATVDLAFSLKQTADYTVIACWAVTPDKDLVLIDLLRDRLDGPDLVPAISRMSARHKLAYVGIEEVQAQSLVLSAARRQGLTVKALVPDRDKVTRAIPATIRMEAEQIFLPAGHAGLGDIENELLTFPNGSHDDIVDVLSYAALSVQSGQLDWSNAFH